MLLGRRRPAVFLPGGHAAPDMPLRLIDFQHFLHLDLEPMVYFLQPLGEILVHRRFGDAAVPGGGADGSLMFDDVHGQVPCPLFHVLSHHLTLPIIVLGKCRAHLAQL